MNETKERIKTVLICVLIAGVLYFTYAVWFFDSPFKSVSFGDLLGISNTGEVVGAGAGSDLEVFGIRPVSILMRDANGARGVVYNSSASDGAYRALRDEIAQVFGSIKSTQRTDEDTWAEALRGEGVFLDYYGNAPVETIKLWLGAGNSASTVCGRYFMLSTDDKNVKVYVKNSDNNTVYEMTSTSASDGLKTAMEGVRADPAFLALESEEEDFQAISGETVIMVSNRPKTYAVSAYNSYVTFGDSVRNACLESFRLRDVTPSTYAEADGTEVYVADMVTLKISPDGIASYSDTRDEVDETLGIGVSFDGETPTLAEKTESARTLAAYLAASLPGSGGIYLIDVAENGENTEVVFGRHIGGVPINMKGTTYFARITITGESVRAAKVNLRGYDISSQSADTLSERLAAAAIKGSGKTGELNLRYADNGDTVISPSWFIGGVKKTVGEENGNELVEG